MPEIKDRQIMVSIEPTFYEAIQNIIKVDSLSMSGYIRTLVIKDLLSRGIIDEKVITRVMLGELP